MMASHDGFDGIDFGPRTDSGINSQERWGGSAPEHLRGPSQDETPAVGPSYDELTTATQLAMEQRRGRDDQNAAPTAIRTESYYEREKFRAHDWTNDAPHEIELHYTSFAPKDTASNQTTEEDTGSQQGTRAGMTAKAASLQQEETVVTLRPRCELTPGSDETPMRQRCIIRPYGGQGAPGIQCKYDWKRGFCPQISTSLFSQNGDSAPIQELYNIYLAPRSMNLYWYDEPPASTAEVQSTITHHDGSTEKGEKIPLAVTPSRIAKKALAAVTTTFAKLGAASNK